MDIFEKENIDIQDIQNLLQNNVEETLNLEFKAAGAIQQPKEIAKDISAMANSAGGLIIYGLEENEHRASAFSFIDGNVYTKERLEQILTTNIFRKIEKLVIHPIRRNNNLAETIYVVKVPESTSSPHMTSEGRYYRRNNFMVLRMEEYEVRNAYNQRGKTNLEITDLIITGGGRQGEFHNLIYIDHHIKFQVKNIGSSIAEIFKLELNIPFLGFSSTANPDLSKYPSRREGDIVIISIPNKDPLFQEEQNPICQFDLRTRNHNKQQVVSNPVVAKLYFMGGVIEREFDLGSLIRFNDIELRNIEFNA